MNRPADGGGGGSVKGGESRCHKEVEGWRVPWRMGVPLWVAIAVDLVKVAVHDRRVDRWRVSY